jgi:hypothetical protein
MTDRAVTAFVVRHLFFARRSEDIQKPPHEAGFLLLNRFHLALIEPDAFATETLVDTNISESDLFKLHSAFRTSHEMESTLLLPFLFLHLRLPFISHLPSQLRFDAGEVFLFGLARFYGHITLQIDQQ